MSPMYFFMILMDMKLRFGMRISPQKLVLLIKQGMN